MKINNVYLGIDPGLATTGVALIENGKIIDTAVLKPIHKKGDDRYFEIAYKILEFILDINKIDTICIETQYMAINAGTSLKLAKLRGVIEGTLHYEFMLRRMEKGERRRIVAPEFIEIAPSQTKSLISKATVRLKREESKKAVRAYIENLYPMLRGEDENVLDAVLLALTGDYMLSKRVD